MREKIKGYEKEGRLLVQRNKQIRSLERDLVSKEEVIHKILAEKEQAMLLANKVSLGCVFHRWVCLTGGCVSQVDGLYNRWIYIYMCIYIYYNM